MARFDAVIFDLFETLVTEFDPAWQAQPSTADRLGVPSATFAEVWLARHADRMTSVVDFREVLREVCAAGSLELDPQVRQLIEILYAERMAAKARQLVGADPRVLLALEQLRRAGIKLGVVSNCSVEEVAAWSESPLAALFDDVTFSYQVGAAKPDRAIYLHACRRLGVAPDRAAFVGDGGSDELTGAKFAGLAAYRARWFLDLWPAERRNRDADGRHEFPAITDPTDLATVLFR